MSTPERIRVLRMIARLNVGGPAIQTISLTRWLEPLGYETTLLRGVEGPEEGSMDPLAEALGVTPVRLPALRRDLGPHDARAVRDTVGWLRRVRPHILHTHTAKAGTVGRVAAMLAGGARPPVVVHTFHGHVLSGDFSPRATKVFTGIERGLARHSTRLVAVSDEVREDLVAYGIAPAAKIEVVRLGFDLSPFSEPGEAERRRVRAATRARLGVPGDVPVVSIVARVVQVKRVDRFLAMARRLPEDTHFLVVGDGDLREALAASTDARALGRRLHWTGIERDIPAICFASDLVVLTSDSEGTPVCLIEAQAAGLAVVSTRVGGVDTVVRDGASGLVVDRTPEALADAVDALLADPARRAAYGRAGQASVLATFAAARLVADVDGLYRRLLAERRTPPRGAAFGQARVGRARYQR